MANNAIKWEVEDTSPTTVLSTQLNSLADGSKSGVGTTYDNGTNLNQYGWLEVVLASLTPAAGNFVVLYMYRYTGGTTEDVAGLQPLATLSFTTTTGAKRAVTRRFELPPFEVAFELQNETGVALGASANTVKLYVANDEVQ